MRAKSLVSILLLLPVVVVAQERPTTVFKSNAELVVVPTYVTRNRRPVRDLKRNEFVVLQDGAPQEVSFFREVDEDAAEEMPTEPETIRNYRYIRSQRATTIVLLDFLNMSALDLAEFQKGFANTVRVLIETKVPATVLALSWDGLVEIMSISGDPNDLLAAAVQWKGMKKHRISSVASRTIKTNRAERVLELLKMYGVTADNAPSDVIDRHTQEFDRKSMVFATVEEIAQAYTGLPGRKKLIWITSDIPMYLRQGTLPKVANEELTPRELTALQSLTDANIAVYPILATQHVYSGLGNRWDSCGRPIVPLFDLIYDTGGSVCSDTPENCVRGIVNDAKHYYLLGFYLHGATKPGWHKLKVKVSGTGLNVRAKQAYMVGLEPKRNGVLDNNVDRGVEAALKSPLDYIGLPLALHWTVGAVEERGRKLNFVVHVAPGVLSLEGSPPSVNMVVAIYVISDEEGTARTYATTLTKELTATDLKQLADIGFQYQTSLTLAPAHYRVKILVRDNVIHLTGTVSTVIDLSTAR